MSALERVWAAIRGGTAIQPVNPRYESPVWWGQFGVPHDLFLTADQQTAVSVAWACIRAIVDPIASSEIKVFEEQKGARREDRESWLWWLLNVEPHPQYTSQAWGEIMGSRAVAAGNSYAFINRDGGFRPVSMQPLDPARVLGDEEGGAIFYRYQDPANGEVRIPEADMIHFRGPMTAGFYGDSPLARASAALALAKAQENYATSYYANGAYPGVLLKPPASRTTGQTPEQKNSARSAWRALFGGPKKSGGIGILDPGWDLQVIATDAEKSQMVEARKFQVAEVLRYFGVPGHLVGISESSQGYGKNLAELGLGFTRQTLEPWSRRFGEELRRKLMPARRQAGLWFIEYDLTRLTKGDEESVARAEDIRLKNGSATINEVRAARGEPSFDGGDIPLVNGKPLDQVLDPPEPAAPPAPEMPALESAQASTWVVPVAAEPVRPAAVLARHASRVRARSTDVASKGGSAADVAKHVEQLRAKARGELRAVGVKREVPAIDAALDAVEHGASPEQAARELTGGER